MNCKMQCLNTYYERIRRRSRVRGLAGSFRVGFGEAVTLVETGTVDAALVNALVEQVLVHLRLIVDNEAASNAATT